MLILCTGVHWFDMPGVWAAVVSVCARPGRGGHQAVRALLQGAGRGEALPLLLPVAAPASRRARYVQQAGHALQQLPGILRRLSEMPRGEHRQTFFISVLQLLTMF